MRKALIILAVAAVAAGVALVASQFLKKSPPPPPIIPSASPTIGPDTTLDDLYREEVRLNDLDVEGADASYEEAIKGAQ
jgi:hypothetical protein